MKFTIDRSKWRAGGIKKNSVGKGSTCLLNDEGFMCCLGQISEQLGYSNLLRACRPSQVIKTNTILTQNLRQSNCTLDTLLAQKAMNINDNFSLTTQEREKQLTELFEENGHELEFINEAVE